jgi:alpha-tubulin suppressor-like RCC1 family protein
MGLRAIRISILVGVVAGAGNSVQAQSGPIVAWGENFAGQAEPQSGLFIAASGTNSTSVAIRADGTLLAWGEEISPAINIPAGTFTAIDGGDHSYIARRTDGTLVGWGINMSGQASPPPGTFLKASIANQHAIGLRTDGSLAYWGASWAGEVPQGNDFIDVAAGFRFSLALRSDGTIEAWGQNDAGQLNVPAGRYTAVVAMDRSGAAIREDGTIAVWGSLNSAFALEGVVVTTIVAGQGSVVALLPDGTLSSFSGPPPVVPVGQFVGIGAGNNHWFAIVPSPVTTVTFLGMVALLSVRRSRLSVV